MSNDSFGDYIRKAREEKDLPVAACLDIDTSTLSIVERDERMTSLDYIKTDAEILQLDIREVQTKFIADKIEKDFGDMEHLSDRLKVIEKHLKNIKVI